MSNPTLHDVARAAGVSYSTADRVLNERGGVAAKSIQRVQRAIQELGYRRDIRAANLSRRRSYRFAVFLPQGDHGFFSSLGQALLAQAEARAADRVSVTLCDPSRPDDAIREGGEWDCAALVGTESEGLAQVMAELTDRGIPAITLVSDIDGSRRGYVGIDNTVAGRTAGRLLRLAHGRGAGRILPVLGSLSLRDHRERLDGAAEVLAAPGSRLVLLPPVEVHDQPDRMRDRLDAALRADAGITGIYSIGAGNRGLIALMEAGGEGRPFVVLHELTPHSRAALERDLIDVVIDQKPAEEAARALDAMRAIADGEEPPAAVITPAIFFKENLPGVPA
ncbi:LacI family DNA-binding transcriptional regulator [Paracoccus benzoatiresistens]|uniref:LacI family DNA-binding transcriptional regulator n=1 Tax=Paracoccus benzoatiresistens TaxID=2997341 RepID=A0ABT4J0S5_9RHOB|nr:LacI family DNA-binding transcriptional regulator [Paracoccus sp. EF6]MCZ0960720.1 LacI family DNA-binding transcriptional regulator [Paracoccus sp. EF6]